MVRMVTDFIRDSAERSPEGGLDHRTGSHQYWVDTLYMACPVLARFGKMDNKPAYIDDAGHQFIVHARRLQDEKTGLFYHMCDWQMRMARGLQASQDRDGLWHTVLNDPTTYAKCSASSMNIYGLLKLVRLKVLPESYKKIALSSWAAVNARYVKDGVVTGVSAGTDPQPLDG